MHFLIKFKKKKKKKKKGTVHPCPVVSAHVKR